MGRDPAGRHHRGAHRPLGDGPGDAHRPRPARRRGARGRLVEGHDRIDHRRPEPRPQPRLGRDVDRRQPRHPRLAGLRPAWRRRGAADAAAGRGRGMEGAGRRARRFEKRRHACAVRALDHLRQARRRRVACYAAGPEGNQAQGSEGLDDRRQAARPPRHGRQARRPQGLRHRRPPARDAQRRDQALPGLWWQARKL